MKHIWFAFVSFFTTVSFAGGPVMPDLPELPSQSGIYLEGQAGYAQTRWNSMIDCSCPITVNSNSDPCTCPTISNYKNGDGGFAIGGDVGYQFNSFLAAEVGGVALPTTSATLTNGTQVINVTKLKEYTLYGAMRMTVPFLYPNLYAFGKVGVGFQDVTVSPFDFNPVISSSHVSPIFAAGLRYQFNMGLSVSLQLLQLIGQQTAEMNLGMRIKKITPSPTLWTAGVGYFFHI